MKKIISISLAAVLLVACFVVGIVAARPGDTVTISYELTQNAGFANFGAKIVYDASALTLESVDAGTLCEKGMFDANLSTGIVGFITSEDVNGTGVLFTATFKVKDGAAPAEYPVTVILDEKSTASAAGAAVDLSLVPSAEKITVTVTPKPTAIPVTPTPKPTEPVQPTATPTLKPTEEVKPTATPTLKPTEEVKPTATPTLKPTEVVKPTAKPTKPVKPTATPTLVPTEVVTPPVEPDEPTPGVTPPTDPGEPEPEPFNALPFILIGILLLIIIIVCVYLIKRKLKK